MKKIITLCLALSFLFSFNAQAQLPDGSIAPDFTATDLDGNEWNLYDVLGEGKSVILDVSATWCGPCWSYHTSGELEEVYENWGPDGTDELMVFMIEGDASTTLDDLNGTGTNTLGDWVSGTAYPIIDNADISAAYGVNAFPTFFHICPSGIIEVETGSFVFSPEELHQMTVDCPESIGTNNARLLDISGLEPCLEGAAFLTADLQNVGASNMISAEIELLNNGVSQQIVPWTGDVSTWASVSVAFDVITVTPSDNIVVSVNSINGGADDDTSDNSLSSSEVINNTNETLEFRIVTDKWPEEIGWELMDDAGTVLYSNPTLECETEYIFSYDLPAYGCYTLSITDDYGDGILNQTVNAASHTCTNGDVGIAIGEIEITSTMGDMIYNDIEYGAGVDIVFISAAIVSTNEVVGLGDFNLFPNPVADQLNVEFSTEVATNLEVKVLNALGQLVNVITPAAYASGNHSLNVNTSSYANGIYFLSVMNGNQVTTKKFTVSK